MNTVFEHVEKLKQDYTDKYVVVDASRPELRRFKDQTGQVKTVNMSGRALVEFDANLNTGWYDIELDYLKVVEKPKRSSSLMPSTPGSRRSANASRADPDRGYS